MTLCKTELSKKIVGKREIAAKQDFLLFPHCFLPYERKSIIWATKYFQFWTSLNFCLVVKG